MELKRLFLFIYFINKLFPTLERFTDVLYFIGDILSWKYVALSMMQV